MAPDELDMINACEWAAMQAEAVTEPDGWIESPQEGILKDDRKDGCESAEAATPA